MLVTMDDNGAGTRSVYTTGTKYQNMSVLSKFFKVATVKNTAFAAVAVSVLWTLARKASANQRRRFW